MDENELGSASRIQAARVIYADEQKDQLISAMTIPDTRFDAQMNLFGENNNSRSALGEYTRPNSFARIRVAFRLFPLKII